jgi:hypothetical protein
MKDEKRVTNEALVRYPDLANMRSEFSLSFFLPKVSNAMSHVSIYWMGFAFSA